MTDRDELIALGGVGVKVKPLEWHEITAARSDEDPSHEPTGDYEAVSSIGVYFIEMYFGSDSYGWSVSLNSDFVSDHDDPCAAKAAAQADYERRILSALEAPAAGDGGPVAWVIPGDGNARDNGALDAMAWSEGEFTKPLYAAQPADAGMREAFVRVLASLAAAISILERTPKAKKAVASDKMFDQMLDDYRNALEIGRAAVRAAHGDEFAAEPSPSDPSSTRSEVTGDARTKIEWWLNEISGCNERMWNDSHASYFGQVAKGVAEIRALLDQFEIRRRK